MFFLSFILFSQVFSKLLDRTFVGTNLNPSWEKFLVPSEDDSVRCQHTSSPLGNGAIIETSDGKILVLKRSYNVGEFPGHFVFPGGHPEPEEVGIERHQHDKNLMNSDIINKKVSQEMFDSIIREVVEETGVPATSLCKPVFIGISRRELNVRPAAFFFMKCTLESNEIQQLYSCAQDGFESTQLYTVSVIELENMTSKMPGCHHGGFTLYKLMVEAQKDI
ncbi:Dihydroneopterin triphosphate diphosphatase [Parasponia andersonii]|uniref:Dihydroneopterin triphosphate diphosphatase n=1 Tax=Parasponia andersonii TaxID=3476 RepID=A0A2P5D129_PARAD|nr:Dihydroneopterin triphosphate diphosphatase [Parasponia andersonii]